MFRKVLAQQEEVLGDMTFNKMRREQNVIWNIVFVEIYNETFNLKHF